MAISHLCLSCGLDLARVRVSRDNALHAPIVTCPECGSSAIRRKPALVKAWRTAMRRRTAAWTLVAQLVVFNATIWSIAGLSWTISHQMQDDHQSLVQVIVDAFRLEGSPMRRFDNVGPWHVSIWIFASLAAGLWLGSALPHWKRWAPYVVWPIGLTTAFSAPFIGWAIWFPVAALAARPTYYDGPSMAGWLIGMQVIAASCVLTCIAVQAGPFARRSWNRSRARRWRKRLARRRLLRGGE